MDQSPDPTLFKMSLQSITIGISDHKYLPYVPGIPGHLRDRKNYFLILLFFVVFNFSKVAAQSSQLWLDYMAYPIQDLNWDYEINVGYNRLLSEGGWVDVYLNNTVTFQKLWWLLFDGSLELHYTYDSQYLNSFEIRPWIMTTARWNTEGEHLNLYKPYIAALFEYRQIFYDGDTHNEQKMRIRTRLGGRITINNKTMAVRTFYVPFRLELFFDLNGSTTNRVISPLEEDRTSTRRHGVILSGTARILQI